MATKADKVGKPLHNKNRNAILDELELVLGNDFVVFSNITKMGKDEILKKIERIC